MLHAALPWDALPLEVWSFGVRQEAPTPQPPVTAWALALRRASLVESPSRWLQSQLLPYDFRDTHLGSLP